MTALDGAEITRHLSLAEALLAGAVRIPRVPAARAACWVARRGLETMVPLLLHRRQVDPGLASMHVQLICLTIAYGDDPLLVSDLANAWDQLSRACHHHAYELTPTTTEVQHLISCLRSAESLLAR
jgi:hypothetical protein